jgi:hypothetical protein
LKVTELLSKNKNNSFIINIILALAIESVKYRYVILLDSQDFFCGIYFV